MLLHLEFPWVSIASDASPREQLRYYREYRGLLRRELGDMTGMSETTILNYELGYMSIAYDKAKRLAKALEIDEKLLFDDYCRFLDYPFQLRCKELRLELGLTQVEIADKAGIARDKIILDPGVGFGKTYEMNLEIIQKLEIMHEFKLPILLGTSRKSVIGLTLDLPADEREEGTLVTTVYAVQKRCAFVRVHDVEKNKRAILMTQALMREHEV